MNKVVASGAESDRPHLIESIVLVACFLTLILAYVATAWNQYAPGRWDVGCCGGGFWWSAVGAAVVLVGCAIALFLRRTWAFVAAGLMSTYVVFYSLYIAFQRWSDYASLDKAYGLGQALLPVYRPLSILLGVFVIVFSMIKVGRTFSLRREKAS